MVDFSAGLMIGLNAFRSLFQSKEFFDLIHSGNVSFSM